MKSHLLALVLAALALPAGANVLYKSVDANGTVMFSDTRPEGATIIEEHVIGAPSTPSGATGAPVPVGGLEEAFQMLDYDAVLAEANARVDMAERALAQARGGGSSRTEGLRLSNMTQVSNNANSDQVEFARRDLKIARRGLMDVLRARQLASGRQPKD